MADLKNHPASNDTLAGVKTAIEAENKALAAGKTAAENANTLRTAENTALTNLVSKLQTLRQSLESFGTAE